MPARGTAASCGAWWRSAFCKRPAPVAGARMHDEPGRLVDDEQRVVLVDDRERDRLRRGCGGVGLGVRVHDDALAAANMVRGGSRSARRA